ncbi:MAG: alpha/beta fold hydrolase [Saprospiraceae bacterium]|nr:alpha/beta fold hydrolase [Saprospiraceae bacterium]
MHTTSVKHRATNWLDREEYPFQSHYMRINEQRIHYLDEGKGDILLFVHGTPLWSFVYRKLIKKLSTKYRCIALDHLGFGLSDKPKDYNYTAQQQAKNLELFIKTLHLKNFRLIVHDFGGPIGLNYALKYPQEIRQLVVFNTWMWSNENDPKFQKMRKIIASPLVPFLYKYLNFSAKILIPKSWGSSSKLSTTIHKQYCKPFGNAGERMGTLGFRNALLNEQAWFESLWEKRANLKQIPALLLWGEEDPYIRLEFMQRFAQIFDQVETQSFPKVGHLVPDEAGEEVLVHLEKFLKR